MAYNRRSHNGHTKVFEAKVWVYNVHIHSMRLNSFDKNLSDSYNRTC